MTSRNNGRRRREEVMDRRENWTIFGITDDKSTTRS
jgi:hypothetical protein